MNQYLTLKKGLIVLVTILVNIILFYFSKKNDINNVLKIIDIFFSVFTLIVITIGISNYKKNSFINITSNITLLILTNGIIIFSFYLTKLFINNIEINIRYFLTLFVGSISILMLFKIHFDLLKKNNVA